MLELTSLNLLPLAIAIAGILLTIATADSTRREQLVPVPGRGKVGREQV